MQRFFLLVLFFLGSHYLLAQPGDNAFQLVNSPYDEQSPVISPDGKTLFITIANHPDNAGGKKDAGDIWFARWIENQWSAPVHAGALLNDRGYNAVAGISADGSQLFLHGHYDASGGLARTQGIAVSRNTGGGWSRPVNISIPYFQNKSPILSGYISADNGVFVFSAETYGTYGVEDIYVCFNEDGRWTEPRNLGSKINTQFQEISPSLSSDRKTLYYSSNGKKGSGSFDVFKATRLDDTWMSWSEPENMNQGLNTGGRELFFRPLPELGYAIYTSTTNSDGYGDIKLFLPEKPFEKDTTPVKVIDPVIKIVEVKKDSAKYNAVKLYGRVTNTKTGESVEATIAVLSSTFTTSVAVSPVTGFDVEIPAADVYSLRIESKGFVSTLEKLDIHTYEMKELEMNFKLQPLEVGTTVNLKNVLFERGTDHLLPESNSELDLVVNFMQTNPKVVIELSGHTDNRGVQSHNARLSLMRVNKVKEYLVSKGISAKRISGKGYGGTKPIASNDTEESRVLNRRVEFTIKKF
ncbi:MAG: OmpA family protein [Cyclobacteriaceae bacterium]|nr:OmpA family protein [Cyclobacteriaceae bacterium]